MSKPAASREILVEAAKALAGSHGLEGINIRDIARECGISVGAVYHYFPSKADLIVAVMEDFWKTVFHPDTCGVDPAAAGKGFPVFFEALYQKAHENLGRFQSGLLEQASRMGAEERGKGKQAEAYYWQHIKDGLGQALQMDPGVKPDLWQGPFTKEGFIDFAFANLIAMLRENRENCAFFTEALRRLLYQKGE